MSAPMARCTLAALVACLLTACSAGTGTDPVVDPARSDRPLRGTTWSVTGLLNSQDGVGHHTPVDPATADAALLIAEDGAVSGSGGCNRLIGTATVRDESPNTATITFRLGATRMMCEPGVMAVEDAVLGVLGEDTGAVVSGDTLTLQARDGRGLVLQAG